MTSLEARIGPIGQVADPLALYVHLAKGRVDTMFFERPGAVSLLLTKAALRVECRQQEVHVTAVGDTGPAALNALIHAFADRVAEEGCARASFSFPRITSDEPAERLTAASPFDMIRALAGPQPGDLADPFARLCLGVLAFDHVDLIEDLPANAADPLGFPDYVFWVPEELIVVEPCGNARAIRWALGNEVQDRLDELVARCAEVPPLPQPAASGPPDFDSVDLDDAAYEDLVRAAKAHILAGDVYQIVPSRTFRAPCSDPLSAFAAQRHADPSPYCFYVAAPQHVLFGCSPETAVRVARDSSGSLQVEVNPIAGTRRRGTSPDEDDRLEAELRLDDKELAEHMMLVDLARNDVARVSEPGTRRVAELLSVERYARVMHLVSSVTGRLADRYDCVHVLQACLNVGTLSGAPKLRATELLRVLERDRRGAYGGAVGWLNGAGEMDTGVVIRSCVARDGIGHVRAGAGIVHDSDPATEAEETRSKAYALLSVLAGATAA